MSSTAYQTPMSRRLWKTVPTLAALQRPWLGAYSGRVEGHCKFIRMSEPVTGKSWQVHPSPQKSPYPLSPTPPRPPPRQMARRKEMTDPERMAGLAGTSVWP